jgi:electron transfer flavoprotein beta subunit
MNILVCLKAVPSTSEVQVDGQFRLQRDGVKLQWNTADEAALEAALQLRKNTDTITVLAMGPKKLEESMKELLARGSDNAVLLSDTAFAGSDTFATANTLKNAIDHLGGFDLILCGRRAIDGETGQVPGMLAAALNIPCITNVDAIKEIDDRLQMNRRLETGCETLNATLPLCVSICEYSYNLRLPGIMGMRKARNKTVQILSAELLSLSPDACGLKGSLTKVVAMDSKFPGLRKGPRETHPQAGVSTLLSILKEVDA